MTASELAASEIQRVIRQENTLNTVVHNLEDYLKHINGIIINFESISDCLKDFFFDKSSYFKPNITFLDELRRISRNYRDHLNSFEELEDKVRKTRGLFTIIKDENLKYQTADKRMIHYVNKLNRLKKEKEISERKGTSLSQKKIERILRNENKLANSRNDTLRMLMNMSKTSKSIHKSSLNIICPILAAFSHSSNKLNKENSEHYSNLAFISPEFLRKEDVEAYCPDIYKEVIFNDINYEKERDRLYKENDTSFVNFFNIRMNKRQPNASRASSSRYERPNLPIIGDSISSGSASFESSGRTRKLDMKKTLKKKRTDESYYIETEENRTANVPLRMNPLITPSNRGSQKSLSYHNMIEKEPSSLMESMREEKQAMSSTISLNLDDYLSVSSIGNSRISRLNKQKSLNNSSSVNGFSFGQGKSFQKKSFNGAI